ncbi:hypothetical protein [Pseudomonas sp. Au-Pse12]|uniref:hypothetical protein n=1 Tax=Pseudomonas sp. Au-Pse12 TaxID=2906459 RepID=UPI001E30D2C6|nr:hypothetical protein [Pseudomonas sp. Au-Pse12]MCE4056322.1 hypothetical protein [Pseudomonas sp. Au-Pse12]
MKRIRDDGFMMGWEQAAVQMALSDDGLFVLSLVGEVRCNFQITAEGFKLLVGKPQDLAVALLSLTGEEPTRLLARFAAFAGTARTE